MFRWWPFAWASTVRRVEKIVEEGFVPKWEAEGLEHNRDYWKGMYLGLKSLNAIDEATEAVGRDLAPVPVVEGLTREDIKRNVASHIKAAEGFGDWGWQASLAEAIGVSRPTVTLCIKRESLMKADSLYQLSVALGVPLEVLVSQEAGK